MREYKKLLLNGKLRIFAYFFFTYLLIILIPLLSFFFSYQFFIQRIEKNITSYNLALIDSSIDNLESSLDDIEKTVLLLENSNTVHNFLQETSYTGPHTNVVNILEQIKEFQNIKYVNSNISGIFLYSFQSDSIITDTELYIDKTLFYQSPVYYIEGNNQNFFFETVLHHDEKISFIPCNEAGFQNLSEGILYCSAVPLTSVDSRKGTLVVCLSTKLFGDFLQKVDIGENGYICVSNEQGQIYYEKGLPLNQESSFTYEKDGENLIACSPEGIKYLFFEKKDVDQNFKYSIYIPQAYILKQGNFIKYMMLVLQILSMALTFVLILIFSKKNTEPIWDLFSNVNDDNEKYSYKDSFQFLKLHIDHIIKSNKNFEEKLMEQFPIVQSNTIYNLLYGNFDTDQTLSHSLALAGINLDSEWYNVMILYRYNSDETAMENMVYNQKITFLIKEMISTISKTSCNSIYFYNIDASQLAIICSFNLCNNNDNKQIIVRDQLHTKKYIINFADKIKDAIFKQLNIIPLFAIGESVTEIKNIPLSFDQANQVMRNRLVDDQNPILHFDDLVQHNDVFLYSYETEQRLSYSIKQGNSERVRQILQNIYAENFIKRQISHSDKLHLFYALYITLVRTVEKSEHNINSEYFLKEYDPVNTNFDLVFDKIISEFLNACKMYCKKEEHHNNFPRQQIMDYIEEKYSDMNFTISIAAHDFQMSERAFYNLFKISFELSFSDYLENIRLTKAKELLLHHDISVEKISESVGYTNVRSFQRAFKRFTGLAPNEFRHL